MKRIGICVLVISTVLVSMYNEASAVRRAGSGGWGASAVYGVKFNPATMETINGEVISAEKFIPIRRMFWGYRVMVMTEKETVEVHLGPGFYVDRVGFVLSPGDKVEVRGSRIPFRMGEAIMATEVKSGGAVLSLRGEDGTPLWTQ
jgi:hypothetical protein